MAIRDIVKVGDPILRKKCRDVTDYNAKLWTLLDDMRQTMHAANGCGLAAPQIGLLRRIAIVEVDDLYLELINADIIDHGGSQTGTEGCLSVPGRWEEVTRPYWVKVRYYDRNGVLHTQKFKDFPAKAICHELDHLVGTLFIDRVEDK